MNTLDALKQKLMHKPNITKHKPVQLIIRNEPPSSIKKKQVKHIKPPKEDSDDEKEDSDDEKEKRKDKKEDSEDEDSDHDKKKRKEKKEDREEDRGEDRGEDREDEESDDDKEDSKLSMKPPPTLAPLIVDQTHKGFDDEDFFKRLVDNNKQIVVTKKTITAAKDFIKPAAKSESEPELKPETKPKPTKISDKIVIEGDEEDFDVGLDIERDLGTVRIEDKKKKSLEIKIPKKKERKTTPPEKGVAILDEYAVEIGDVNLLARMPKKLPLVNIRVPNYYMNNREIFIEFINSIFQQYKDEIDSHKEEISCDKIGKTGTDFSLLTHQKIVRDYINLYTPYRGLLLFHGLGSGKTCTSIAIAEGMKSSKRVIIMTPASLRANYIEELKKCGDLLYKRKQNWEWFAVDRYPQEILSTISNLLNLPMSYIKSKGGAFFVNVSPKKDSIVTNYDSLTDAEKKILEDQLNKMIERKYIFINYNGLRPQKLFDLTKGFTQNIFDNSVVIIDEAHNFISRIVNKLQKEAPAKKEETFAFKQGAPTYALTKPPSPIAPPPAQKTVTKTLKATTKKKAAEVDKVADAKDVKDGADVKEKKPRCEKGTRRNPKTGNCEKYPFEKKGGSAGEDGDEDEEDEEEFEIPIKKPASKKIKIVRADAKEEKKERKEAKEDIEEREEEREEAKEDIEEREEGEEVELDTEEKHIFGDKIPKLLSNKLYYMLLRSTNTKVVLLTGTPIINYPNEFGILFNILRGYIKTWKFTLNVETKKKIDTNALYNILNTEKTMDYIDYSASSKVLTLTRNPFGFKNKFDVKRKKSIDIDSKPELIYKGVSNISVNKTRGQEEFNNTVTSDEKFERTIQRLLLDENIKIVGKPKVINYKALPDNLDNFISKYIDPDTRKLKNTDALKRRIIGLSSFFRSAQESLLPKYEKELGRDYHVIEIPMSDVQFRIHEKARSDEREALKKKRKSRPPKNIDEIYQEDSSTYRIFSRLYCNYVIPGRPVPEKKPKNPKKKKGEESDTSDDSDSEDDSKDEKGKPDSMKVSVEIKSPPNTPDLDDEKLGEIEGDEILTDVGGRNYKESLDAKMKELEDNPEEYLSKDALQTYSPKFLHILENVQDEGRYPGLHLIYSQFRTSEGIGIFSLVLENNGFTRFKIKKNARGEWVIDIPPEKAGLLTFALYTGTETSEEKEILRHIYNGEWDDVPLTISSVLKRAHINNNMGQVIKVLMITSSGSEGINLRNTQYVHIMEPYWHPVRLEQVIGRARRICSHKDLPLEYQKVEVFVYLMKFTDKQLESEDARELNTFDVSQITGKVNTSDQYLYEISEIKSQLNSQLLDAIKESAFDCYIYSNGKCMNFGDPTNEKSSYVPDFEKQENDTIIKANQQKVEWKGKLIKIKGKEYIYKEINANIKELYDKQSYLDGNPIKVAMLETRIVDGKPQHKYEAIK